MPPLAPPAKRRAVSVNHEESEDEDQPRVVLDTLRDFTLLNSNPPYVFKLDEFDPASLGSLSGAVVLAVHPVPIPADVARAKAAMGAFEHGVWTGTKFTSSETPDFLFPVRMINTLQEHVLERFCIRRRFAPHISPLKTMLMYTDGACSNNGRDAPRGGFSFVFNDSRSGSISQALENRGPDGKVHTHTNNRAELRAVIAALRFRHWAGEGWERIVVATDSEYVGKGATEWLRGWAGRGWRTANGFTGSGSGRRPRTKPIANQDLWRALSEALGICAEAGCEVSFWVVPRVANARADGGAKEAAERGGGSEEYRNAPGVMV